MASTVTEADLPSDGPLYGFGQYANLWRWSQGDIRTTGDQGPLPPRNRGRPVDTTDDDLYSNLMMGRGIFGPYAGALSQWFAEPRDRPELYRIYDEMDKTEYAGGVLDLFAEDITPIDEEVGRTMWVVSEDEGMVTEANDLQARLHTEEEIVALARDICKYGDAFERTVYDNIQGIKRLVPCDPKEMIRHENKEGKLEGYRQHNRKFRGMKADDSFPWDFVHFRARGRNRRYPYGTGLLQNAIRPWRQLVILEDWMMTYQVSKHPDRNLFILDAGTQTEQEAGDLVRRFNNKLRRYMVVDPMGTSGTNAIYRPNPITPLEDIVMAIRQGSQTRVEKLSGSANATDIGPIALCTDKFYMACRAPKGYFGFNDPGAPAPVNMKEPLSDQDVRYARSCKRIQRSLKAGYTYVHELNYKLRSGTNPEKQKFDWTESGKAFRVEMAQGSRLEELDRLNIQQIRCQVAASLTDMSRDNAAYKAAEWTAYILANIMQLPALTINKVLRTSDEMNRVQGAWVDAGGPPGGMFASADPDIRKKMIEDARAESRAHGVLHNGDGLSTKDKRLLSEIVGKNPELRRLINLGALLHKPDDNHPGLKWDSLMLPSGKAESSLSEADFQQMMAETVHEHSRAGA